MSWFFLILKPIYNWINFSELLKKYIEQAYVDFKIARFDNLVLKCSFQNKNNQTCKMLYDYDTFLNVLWLAYIYDRKTDCIMGIHDIKMLDLNGNILTCTFVKNGRIHQVITDDPFIIDEVENNTNDNKILYCVLNHEQQCDANYNILPYLDKFKNSLSMNKTMKCLNVINSLLHYNGKDSIEFSTCKLMMDSGSYDEVVFNRNDILCISN